MIGSSKSHLMPRRIVERSVPPDSRDAVQKILICGIIFPTLSIAAVVGRIAIRRIQKSKFYLDDWLILPALAATLAHQIIVFLDTFKGGLGTHRNELTPEVILNFSKFTSMTPMAYGSSMGLAKISICLFLMRIFSTRRFRMFASIVLLYMVLFTLMSVFVGAFICFPFAYHWDKTIAHGRCGNRVAAYVTIAAADLAGDTMLVILPLPVIWNLQTSLSKKIGLTVIFTLGFMDMICGAVRIEALGRIDYDGDFTYQSVAGFIWSAMEPCLAVVVACLPTLQPLFVLGYQRVSSNLESLRGRLRLGSTSKVSTHNEPPSEKREQKQGDISLIYAELREQ